MKVTIEFTGLAQSIAQTNSIDLQMAEGSTYRDLVRTLAEMYPDFVGVLIAEDRSNFLSSNMFVIDGDLEFPAMIMDHCPKDGEHIFLMSVITGG